MLFVFLSQEKTVDNSNPLFLSTTGIICWDKTYIKGLAPNLRSMTPKQDEQLVSWKSCLPIAGKSNIFNNPDRPNGDRQGASEQNIQPFPLHFGMETTDNYADRIRRVLTWSKAGGIRLPGQFLGEKRLVIGAGLSTRIARLPSTVSWGKFPWSSSGKRKEWLVEWTDWNQSLG